MRSLSDRYNALASHRHRLFVEAWDDKTSDLYKALNFKSSSYLGVRLTFFSAKNWYDLIDGDSTLVKDIKSEIRNSATRNIKM